MRAIWLWLRQPQSSHLIHWYMGMNDCALWQGLQLDREVTCTAVSQRFAVFVSRCPILVFPTQSHLHFVCSIEANPPLFSLTNFKNRCSGKGNSEKAGAM